MRRIRLTPRAEGWPLAELATEIVRQIETQRMNEPHQTDLEAIGLLLLLRGMLERERPVVVANRRQGGHAPALIEG